MPAGVVFTKTGANFQPSLPLEQWGGLAARLNRAIEKVKTDESQVQWTIADWLRFGEDTYGEEHAQYINDLGYDEGYQRYLLRVARAFPHQADRSGVLAFNHHRVVLSLDPEHRQAALRVAEAHHWGRTKFSQFIADFRKQTEGFLPEEQSRALFLARTNPEHYAAYLKEVQGSVVDPVELHVIDAAEDAEDLAAITVPKHLRDALGQAVAGSPTALTPADWLEEQLTSSEQSYRLSEHGWALAKGLQAYHKVGSIDLAIERTLEQFARIRKVSPIGVGTDGEEVVR